MSASYQAIVNQEKAQSPSYTQDSVLLNDDEKNHHHVEGRGTFRPKNNSIFLSGLDDEDDDDEEYEHDTELVSHTIDIAPGEDVSLRMQSSTPPVPSLLYRNSVTKDTFVRKITEFTRHFIDFEALHAIIDEVANNKPNSNAQFLQRLDAEWNVYQRFVESEATKITLLPVEKYVMLDVLKFNQFVCINQRSLQDLIRKYDSLSLQGNLCAIWDWKMNWKPQKMVFSLIKKISHLYREEERENMAQPRTPSNKIDEFSFDRKSVKYFVKRSNLIQVVGIIIQHLPIFVFGEKDGRESHVVSQNVSSVYFDSDDFKCYHERVGKEEGARVFRIRWYGDKEPVDAKSTVFMERKIHHQSWLNAGPSMKERFTLKSGKVCGFLNGSLNIPEDQQSKRKKLMREIYGFVRELKMRPRTRTVCDRISFQLPHNNDLRISLDLNLKFVKERPEVFAARNTMWFSPLEMLCADDVAEFAFDVLEIKLAGAFSDNPPQWVQDMMSSALLCECHKFSKYGQSVHEFYADSVSIVPKWIENVDVLRAAFEKKQAAKNVHVSATTNARDVKITIHAPERRERVAERRPRQSCLEGSILKPMMGDCVCHCPKNPGGGRRKFKPVNPKVHFSSERTFLQWFKAAIFIGSSGLSVNALVPDQPAGLMMVSVAGVIVLWSMVVYYIRNWKLLTGQMEGLHDFWGPGFLGCLLLFLFVYAALDENVSSGFNHGG